MKINCQFLIILIILLCGQMAYANPGNTPTAPETSIEHQKATKAKHKKKRTIKERFRQWKAKTAGKIMNKLAKKAAKLREDSRHGIISVILAASALGLGAFSFFVILVGAIGYIPVLVGIGAALAIIAQITGIVAFAKALKGLKHDENIKPAIAGLAMGSLFVIGLFIFLLLFRP